MPKSAAHASTRRSGGRVRADQDDIVGVGECENAESFRQTRSASLLRILSRELNAQICCPRIDMAKQHLNEEVEVDGRQDAALRDAKLLGERLKRLPSHAQ